MKQHQRHHIVILGAGFAGLAAALELERLNEFSTHPYNVTLVDKNCYHLYHALLYEVATAREMVKAKDLEALRRGVCIRIKALDDILLKRKIFVVQDQVMRINPTDRLVQLTDGSTMHFDELIIALGSVSNDFRIPGLAEHSLALKELPDALDMNLKLQSLIHRAQRGAAVRIIIGGGGISGVETAGELQHYFRRLQTKEKLPVKSTEVVLVEASATILPGFDRWAQQAADQRLQRLGVRIITGQPIVSVEASALKLKNGLHQPFDLFIWSGGIRAHPLIGQLGLASGPKGQAAVQPTLQAPGFENIFVVGDSAGVIDAQTQRPVPQTAPEAVAQGHLAASNLFHRIHHQPLEAYAPQRAGFVFPVGGRWAVSTMGGWKINGFWGWIIRKVVDLNYFMSILSFKNAWQVFWTGGRIYLRND